MGLPDHPEPADAPVGELEVQDHHPAFGGEVEGHGSAMISVLDKGHPAAGDRGSDRSGGERRPPRHDLCGHLEGEVGGPAGEHR